MFERGLKYWMAALLVIASANVSAVPVTVQELSVSPYKVANINVSGFYSGGVYAGIVNLKVNGVETDGFCIDPFHFSSRSPLQYEMVSLSEAPKSYTPSGFDGEMGALKADKISKLWGMAFSTSMTASQAAAMQIAIWEIVAGDLFAVIGNDFGASTLLAQLETYTGPAANLVGLTGPGQDYVIATVPDGGATALLLLIGFGAMSAVRMIGRKK